jgi:lipid-A-disaccharide synthase
MLGAWQIIKKQKPGTRAAMVLPNDNLVKLAQQMSPDHEIPIQAGGLADLLQKTTVALASTGTVTLECAFFGVPTVALYKTSWSTYQIARRLVQVKHLAMPNLLADAPIYPEFIQDAATVRNLGQAALTLLNDDHQRAAIRRQLAKVIDLLGAPGACARGARAIWKLCLPPGSSPPGRKTIAHPFMGG